MIGLASPAWSSISTSHRERSFCQAIVFLERFTKAIVRQGDDRAVIDASHGIGCNHGIDDGLLGSLDGGKKNRVKRIVWQHRQLMQALGTDRSRVGRGEGDEDVARSIAGVAA